ncbi:extracellular solute-binding protein [Mesobacterium pallidum]|uniref:extracellular solute-binding protein n=1 Tax=Mesobacterium pallidum TaxID=2872037 RepID=UPI001EE28E38|nr:extracellular solute-binding protein [Mesobacterium pallidum]
MRPNYFHVAPLVGLAALAVFGLSGPTLAEPAHGIAMYGYPALPPDFVSLPYANPEAPKGGRITFGEVGTFDSLNPFILKGNAPWQQRAHLYESLMGRSRDEPFTLYGLLAESIETGPNREWVEFTLRPEARFSDGSPVTVEDVIWSFETLGTVGHPRYLTFWTSVSGIEQVGERTIRIAFSEDNAELALIAGLRPILKKAQWDDTDFTRSSLSDVPIGSGPYVIGDYEPGRYVTFQRDPDYWGADLGLRRGTNNFDQIRIEYFGDAGVVFEAFKAGTLTVLREQNAELWQTRFDFPAIDSGDVVKSEIPDQRPSGMQGLVMNSRRPVFADWRVREAMIQAFNFEYVNDTLTGGRQPRITSYFSNSSLGMEHGPATGVVRDLLEPFAADLPPGALEGYDLPVSDGSARNRAGIRAASDLLAEAGWTVEDGQLRGPDGQPFAFEVLLRKGSQETQSIMDIYARALERLGMQVTVSTVDDAQWEERKNALDFDVTYFERALSLSPGTEQRYYWASDQADQPGSRNLMGVKSPAVDAMIDTLLTAEDPEVFTGAVKALDRALMAGRYVIPFYRRDASMIAHASSLRYPDTLPIYGDWGTEWLPEVWWSEE